MIGRKKNSQSMNRQRECKHTLYSILHVDSGIYIYVCVCVCVCVRKRVIDWYQCGIVWCLPLTIYLSIYLLYTPTHTHTHTYEYMCFCRSVFVLRELAWMFVNVVFIVYTKISGASRRIIIRKLERPTITSEFESHWVLHTSGFVSRLI